MTAIDITRLHSRWADGQELLSHFEDGEPAQLLIPGLQTPARDGELCQLVVHLDDRGADFRLHVHICTRSSEGVRVEFLPEERQRLEVLLVAARGESLPYLTRRFPRIACELKARLTLPDGSSIDTTVNEISAGGAFVAASTPLPIDARLVVDVVFPGNRKLEVRARIVQSVATGPVPGNSVEFLFSSAEERQRCTELVNALPSRARTTQ